MNASTARAEKSIALSASVGHASGLAVCISFALSRASTAMQNRWNQWMKKAPVEGLGICR